jgi:integrase
MPNQQRAYFGNTRELPSGRHQARYIGPDGKRYSAKTESGRPLTFDTKKAAEAYLSLVHADIQRGTWQPPATEPAAKPLTFAEFAETWMRTRKLAPRTRHHYGRILARFLLPAFGEQEVGAITPTQVRRWYATLDADTPTMRAHTYALLKDILATAVADEVRQSNPCKVEGASSTKRKKKIHPATVPELAVITETMPQRLRLMVLFGAWCAMRYEEVAELRRKDIDLDAGVIEVSRAVTFIDGERIVGPPKSEAGYRAIAIPPHLMAMVQEHLAGPDAQAGREGLLFPSSRGKCQMSPPSFYVHYNKARKTAGRPDLNFHALRHTGAVLAAATGATIAELMARLGHSTPAMAMRYQHAAQDRDRAIADALSKLADPDATKEKGKGADAAA